MSRTVGYARLVNAEDDERVQVQALRSAGATKVFTTTTTGDRRSDTALSELVADLRPGDSLVVTRASRLAPNLSQFVATLAELGRRGIPFRSLAEPTFTTRPDVVPAVDVIMALDALRRELIGLRTREGLAEAARNGRRPGRPTVMTPDRISMARELRAGGRPLSQVASALGVSPSAVRRALQPTTEPS